MEHIVSLLYHVFGAILFCLALTFCFIGVNMMDDILKVTLGSKDYGVIGSSQIIYNEPLVTSGDIIGLFLTGLEQDIVINGTLYEKELGYLYLLEEILPPYTYYRKDCIYNEDTKLEQIIFTPIG